MPAKSLNQVRVAALLRRATTGQEVEDVLSAYVYSKAARGNTPGDLVSKLHLLRCYLLAVDLRHIVREPAYAEAWQVLSFHVREHGGGAIGCGPPRSQLGVEAWNMARRTQPRPRIFRAAQDAQNGWYTPAAVHVPSTSMAPVQRTQHDGAPAEDESDPRDGPGPLLHWGLDATKLAEERAAFAYLMAETARIRARHRAMLDGTLQRVTSDDTVDADHNAIDDPVPAYYT